MDDCDHEWLTLNIPGTISQIGNMSLIAFDFSRICGYVHNAMLCIPIDDMTGVDFINEKNQVNPYDTGWAGMDRIGFDFMHLINKRARRKMCIDGNILSIPMLTRGHFDPNEPSTLRFMVIHMIEMITNAWIRIEYAPWIMLRDMHSRVTVLASVPGVTHQLTWHGIVYYGVNVLMFVLSINDENGTAILNHAQLYQSGGQSLVWDRNCDDERIIVTHTRGRTFYCLLMNNTRITSRKEALKFLSRICMNQRSKCNTNNIKLFDVHLDDIGQDDRYALMVYTICATD